AGDPEVFESPDRTHERVAVRCESEGTVHHLADADLAERRKVLEADLEAGRDALQVIRQKTLREVPRRRLRRPRHAGALVGAEQHPAALLARVDLALEVDAMQLFLLSLERRDVLGDEVLVLHGQNWQLQPYHASDLARPE